VQTWHREKRKKEVGGGKKKGKWDASMRTTTIAGKTAHEREQWGKRNQRDQKKNGSFTGKLPRENRRGEGLPVCSGKNKVTQN